jgi:DNA ligase-1
MRHFAALIDRLAFTPSRTGKLALLERYFRETPGEDAGVALAILTGTLKIPAIRASALRDLIRMRVDPVLFDLSYDYVGDQAETMALLWPSAGSRTGAAHELPSLGALVAGLQQASKKEVPGRVTEILDAATPTERWAFLKLVTGATLRIGVSARLAKMALARAKGRDPDELEKVWSAFRPPYQDLLTWLDGRAEAPALGHQVYFHPPLLAQALDESELGGMIPADFAAEWKWDGIRIQLASDGGGQRRLFSRSGDEISSAFPEVLERADFHAVVDGELLVVEPVAHSIDLPGTFGDIAPFAKLQQRLNRKKVSTKLQQDFPVVLCLYDLLFLEGEDVRDLPWSERRKRLGILFRDRSLENKGFRLSPEIPFVQWAELRALREQSRAHDLEGLMLKRRDSPYVPGRPKGLWFKWKRTTLNIDAVLMYAQRGHGKRSSYYSDYTFGLWRPAVDGTRELVPVGKAYSGFTDEELGRLDKWIRANTVERFGSVRSVIPGLVLEVEFDAVQRSTRHKSGVALRFPRIQRIRWDKPAEEADPLSALQCLLPPGSQP